MQLLARAAFPLGWCRISLASPSHVWKLWELWELHLELVAPSGVRLRLGFVIAVVDLSHLATKSQHQMVLGKKKIPFESFKIFDELICYRSPLILCFHIQLLIQKNTQVLT